MKTHLERATFLHQIGDTDAAKKMYGQILQNDPNNSDILGRLAYLSCQEGDHKTADKLWRRSLSQKAEPIVFLPILNAYLNFLQRHKPRFKDQLKFCEMPVSSALLKLGDTEKKLLMSNIDMLVDFKEFDLIVALLKAMLNADANELVVLYELSKSLTHRKEHELALKVLEEIGSRISPDFDFGLMRDTYISATKVGNSEVSREIEARMIAESPILIGNSYPSQLADILITNGRPAINESAESVDQIHFAGNYPQQLPDQFFNDFRFTHISIATREARAAANQAPKPSLIINNHTNAAVILEDGSLEELSAFLDGFGVPIINHPKIAVLTTRDSTYQLLNGIKNLIVPKTQRFTQTGKIASELIAEIEREFCYPMIARTLHAQVGDGMTKVDDRGELEACIKNELPDDFFITQFIDTKEDNEFYRKFRAAVVGNEIVLIRADFHPNWKVHGRLKEERAKFYKERPHLLERENIILADPEKHLGITVFQTLKEIREKIPLDIFGIDFDVDKSGRIVFYEANATMLLFSATFSDDVRHPIEAELKMKDAMKCLFTSKISESAAHLNG